MDKFIATDFDGTIFENAWPEIGAPIPEVILYLKEQQKAGAKIGLWTCREGQMLIAAVRACRDQGLYFDCVNRNFPERIDFFHTDPRKIGADEYIDDRAVTVESIRHPILTWTSVDAGLPTELKKDGSINWVLVFVQCDCDGEYEVGYFKNGQWYDQDLCEITLGYYAKITHWMPLPADPKEDK